MVTTTQVTVSKAWVKLSDGDCTIQAAVGNNYNIFQISVNATAPTTDACIALTLSEPKTFAYKTPVWCRISPSINATTDTINIIK